MPLRPFWAVVSYAGSLMGYIALQLALDFSPAVLGLLFALLAPFPTRKTRLGAAWDGFLEKRFPRKTEPQRPDPFVAPLAGDRSASRATRAPADDLPGDEDIAVAQPTRSADVDDGDEAIVEPEERSASPTEAKPQSKVDPRFEDEQQEEDDHIRDGKPGDVRSF